jgi:acylphosphatase
MDEENRARLHATLKGRVQGVSFRYFVLDQAQLLDLTGWVRNRWNGSVEVTAEGTRPKLEQLLLALRDGPPMSTVSDMDVEWLPYTDEFVGFQVTRTV